MGVTDDYLTVTQCSDTLLKGRRHNEELRQHDQVRTGPEARRARSKFVWTDFEVIVDAILHTIRDGLARGDRVELRGFGTFALRKYAARIGCNPRTKVRFLLQKKSFLPSRLPKRCIGA